MVTALCGAAVAGGGGGGGDDGGDSGSAGVAAGAGTGSCDADVGVYLGRLPPFLPFFSSPSFCGTKLKTSFRDTALFFENADDRTRPRHRSVLVFSSFFSPLNRTRYIP